MARRGKSQAKRSGNGSLPGWVWLLIGAALALTAVLVAPKYFNSSQGQRADGFFRPRPNPEARPSISALDEADPPRPRPAASQRPLPAPVTEPDYDFYTLLPEQTAGGTDAQSTARSTPPPQRPAPPQAHPDAATPAATAATPPPAATSAPTPAPRNAATSPATTTARSTPPRGRAETKPTLAPSRYLLQAGTFSNPAEAEAIKAQIALLGLQARVEAGTADGKPVHRVRLGPYSSENELNPIKQRLDNGGLSAQIVRVQ